jgi:hypothetical protein
MANQDWFRPLTEPLVVGRRALKTLADVRRYLSGLSPSCRIKPGWEKVSHALVKAACDGNTREVTRAFQAAWAAEALEADRHGAA